jgi:hypothetical protein
MADRSDGPGNGPASQAYYALEGLQPEECIAEYLTDVQETLGAVDAGLFEFLPGGRASFDADLMLVLIGLAAALDPNGQSKIKLTVGRRTRGKPINEFERARRGHKAASAVEKIVATGVKQEAAVAELSAEFRLSRSEIFSWLASGRRMRAYVNARRKMGE